LENKGDAFMGESYLVASSSTMLSTVEQLHCLSQTWERDLFSTGGAINLQTIFLVLMYWRWQCPLHNHKLELTVGCDTDILVEVPQLSLYDSCRTLGANNSPSGGMQKAYKVLREQSVAYATRT